jgi:amidohydrolase
MGGDDFSAFAELAPACYAFVGAGGEYPHHHPRFRIDERALAIGTGLHVAVATRALEVFR